MVKRDFCFGCHVQKESCRLGSSQSAWQMHNATENYVQILEHELETIMELLKVKILVVKMVTREKRGGLGGCGV